MFVFVGAEFINFMEALNTAALNFLLFWYLSKVHGLYLACRSCAGAVTEAVTASTPLKTQDSAQPIKLDSVSSF